jgi:hypothetical protein
MKGIIRQCFSVSVAMVQPLKLLPSKRKASTQLYCGCTTVSSPSTSWLLNLGSGWYEAECCQCGADLLLAPGDVVSVIVADDQNIEAVLCTKCTKIAKGRL